MRSIPLSLFSDEVRRFWSDVPEGITMSIQVWAVIFRTWATIASNIACWLAKYFG